MKDKRKFWTIGALGLSDGENKLLMSMTSLTRARAEGGYVIGTPDNMDEWNIAVVNVDDPNAMIQWRTLAARPRHPTSVLYTTEPPTDPKQRYLLRPFGPAKLLAVLDGIAVKLEESSEVWEKPNLQQTATGMHAAFRETTLRALVVDDSPTVSKQISTELRNSHMMVDVAETGERALELLQQHTYNLIFLDVILPGTDGYQVCKEIRKNPKTKQTPVIMLTSKSSPFDRVRGSLVGCSAYLTKPVDYTAFRETVGKFIATAE
jgi:twitching motility two-component system response regulator PilG